MTPKPHFDPPTLGDPIAQPMQEREIREALNKHWHASAAGDANAEHEI